MSIKLLAGVVVAVLMIGCEADARNSVEADGAPPGAVDESAGGATPADPETTTDDLSDVHVATEPETQADRVVLFVGTSLTAGLGVADTEAYPRLIQERIRSDGLPFRVVNAGVSGETSAGALARIDWLLRQDFDVLVLETGANDMLRGVDPAAVERNVQAIVDRVRAARPDAEIILAGMLALPNLGREYGEQFEALYARIAEANDLTLIPFLLDGVAADPALNQADGIHPNPAGHRRVAETVWRYLRPVLEEAMQGAA